MANQPKKFPIHELVQQGNTSELKRYIESEKKKKKPLQLNQADSDNKTLLHIAVQTHRLDIVELLLSEHADVTVKDADGYTPLHAACTDTGNEAIIRLLLQQPGLEINTGNRDGNTALHYFCRNYSSNSQQMEQIFKLFIERGAKLDVQNSKLETPLHTAVLSKNVAVVTWLLNAGAQTNIFAEKGDTPLHRAVMMDQPEIVGALLKAGANPLLSTPNQKAPAELARTETIKSKLREAAQAQKRAAEMAQWLRHIGLDKYTQQFLKDEWDLSSISMITEDILIQMGLPPAPRLRFLKEAREHAARSSSTGTGTAAAVTPAGSGSAVSAVSSVSSSAALLTDEAEAHTVAALSPAVQTFIIDYKDLKMGELLGKGFFAEVRRAEWCGCKVAVKILYRESFKNKSDLELFYQETEILSKLRFPNVVQFCGFTTGEHRCLVFEYMKEGSLYSLLHDRPDLVLGNIKTQLAICSDIAKGMDYLHSRRPPIVHRDLTSKNVLLGEHYIAKVADFGLSKEKKEISSALTHSVGALPWAAPEVFRGEAYTEAADAYSYGIIVWEVFTGQDPQGDLPPLQFAQKVAYEQYRPPMLPSIPAPIEELVRKCWAAKPVERPTFEQLNKMLRHIAKQKDPHRLSKTPAMTAAQQTALQHGTLTVSTPNSGGAGAGAAQPSGTNAGSRTTLLQSEPVSGSNSAASSLANSSAVVTPPSRYLTESDATAALLAQYAAPQNSSSSSGAPSSASSSQTPSNATVSSSSSSPSPGNSLQNSMAQTAPVRAHDEENESGSGHSSGSSGKGQLPRPRANAGAATPSNAAPGGGGGSGLLDVYLTGAPPPPQQQNSARSASTPAISPTVSLNNAANNNNSGGGGNSNSGAALRPSSSAPDKPALLVGGSVESANSSGSAPSTGSSAAGTPVMVRVSGSGNIAAELSNSGVRRDKKPKKEKKEKKEKREKKIGESHSHVGIPAAPHPMMGAPTLTPNVSGVALLTPALGTGAPSSLSASPANSRAAQLAQYHQFAFRPATKSAKPGLQLSQQVANAAAGAVVNPPAPGDDEDAASS